MRPLTLRDLTWGLAGLTVIALAAVVLIELLVLSPGTTGAGDVVTLRPIVRIAAASALGLLIAAIALRQRDRTRPAVSSAETADEVVAEPESFSGGTKRFALVAAIVMVLLGILGLLGFGLIGLGFLSYAPLVGAVSLAFVVGGIIGVIQAGQSLAGTPSRRLRLPPPWMMILAFVLTVAAGEVTRRAGGEVAFSFVPLLFLGAALPPLVVLSLAAGEVGRPPSRRRVLMAMVAGGTVSGLAAVALDMRAVCRLPIVLDAGGGWGDPVHVHRTIALAEAAGFAAIEIEDQLLPRRVEHHAGVDHLIPTELMLKKIAEAIAARTDPDFVIIARTNARRVYDLDEALRRAEAFHRAGADMLFVHTRDAEEMRTVGERLPPPLMTFAPPDGFSGFPFSPRDLAGLGYRLAASSGTAFAAMVKAVRQSYECLAHDRIDPFLGPGGADKEMKAAQTTCGLERLLEIERRTMKDH